jgi:hypothetical protein
MYQLNLTHEEAARLMDRMCDSLRADGADPTDTALMEKIISLGEWVEEGYEKKAKEAKDAVGA